MSLSLVSIFYFKKIQFTIKILEPQKITHVYIPRRRSFVCRFPP